MGTNFPRRPRLPTTAEILDVNRAFDSQTRAIILRAFAHVTAQQRRLVFSLRDAAAFEQLARRLHRLPSPCIEKEFLGNRNIAHGRATSRILCVCENPRAVYPPRAGYFGREFAIRSSTSAWHGSSSAHQQARSL